jgi:enoyl-[acyl-carrier protein] reductase/trans-2-enoyl-CoA reductase (NAD+)
MVVEPKILGFICTTAHPTGCAAHVRQQIDYVKARGPIEGGPKNVLVIGASTGYGLATRIAAAFGSGAATFGVYFERPADGGRTATAGWYNTAAFTAEAQAAGLKAANVNGDAFSDDIKNQVCERLAKEFGPVDLVVYSLASPRRTHPKTGEVFQSALKPVGSDYTNKTIDTSKGLVRDISLQTATEEEIRQTAMVMGGEDWKMWIDQLEAKGLLAAGCKTVAYSYIGPVLTYPIYRQGTIGRAKEHLEATARDLDRRLAAKGGRALVAVNKALVTQASSAIPVVPLYIAILYKVMKAKGIHEACIEQMDRLFRESLYARYTRVDDEGRIRMDDWELREDVQTEVEKIWKEVSTENVGQLTDLAGYQAEFLKLFGFGLPGVAYGSDVSVDVPVPG